MNWFKIVETIKAEEGFSAEPYQDSLGVWTIGYGSTWAVGFDGWERVNRHTRRINERQAEIIMFEALGLAIKTANSFSGGLEQYTDAQQDALIMMSYQLGNRIYQFRRMQSALLDGRMIDAAGEALDSLWAQQTPRRARIVAELLTQEVA